MCDAMAGRAEESMNYTVAMTESRIGCGWFMVVREPNASRTVQASGYNKPSIRAELCAGHAIQMIQIGWNPVSSLQIPDAHFMIEAGRDKDAAVGAERGISDPTRVWEGRTDFTAV